jgi:predicted Zn-dependent protease
MKKNNERRLSGKTFVILVGIVLLIVGCVTNPLTGKRTMAFYGNDELFPMSFEYYDEFLNENKVVTGTAQAAMVDRVGKRLATAAQKWLESKGESHYLDDYAWDYKLVQDDNINAFCLPGGKIVVYTGILPVTKDEAGLAVVLGHEISHALLNHGQQSMSQDLASQLGMLAVLLGAQALGLSENAQMATLVVYQLANQFGAELPFSRKNESEADEYGLYLMSIAGYNPDAAAPFWERMKAAGAGSNAEFFSTHPSPDNRIKNLQSLTPAAKKLAAEFGVRF